jgi:hypothetical protein
MKPAIDSGNENAVAVGSANMPVSTMDTAIGDELLIRTETEIAGSFQTGDVILSAMLGTVPGFVTKFRCWLGAREEGLFQ